MPKVDEINVDGTPVAGTPEPEAVVAPETPGTAGEPAEEAPADLPQWAKDRIAKLEEERGNLSKAVTRLNQERKAAEPVEPESEEPATEWDDDSKKFQKETLTRAEKAAEQKAQALFERQTERAAIQAFTESHPELSKQGAWGEVIANYAPKNGKDTQQAIIKDLERALFLTKYEKGELTPKEENKAEKMISDLSSVSKTASKPVRQQSTLTPGEIRLAEAMRVDLKKLAAEDLSQVAEIKL